MSVHVSITDEDHETYNYQLASSVGWAKGCAWLRNQGSGVLIELVEGEIYDTQNLSDALQKALSSNPPRERNVRHTLEQLLQHIGVGHPEESLIVSD